MSNPTQVGKSANLPVLLEVTATIQTIDTDVKKQYLLQHNAIDTDGNAAADAIAVSFNEAVPSLISGGSKAVLKDSAILVVGPGISSISYVATIGLPTATISPVYDRDND